MLPMYKPASRISPTCNPAQSLSSVSLSCLSLKLRHKQADRLRGCGSLECSFPLKPPHLGSYKSLVKKSCIAAEVILQNGVP